MSSAILRAFRRGSQAAPWDNERSIREELFSIERLEQHAETLAAAQPITARPMAGRSLAARLKQNEEVLLAAYRAIAKAVGEGRAITPSAEWLLDNYHLVEDFQSISLPCRATQHALDFSRLASVLRRSVGCRVDAVALVALAS